MSNPHATSQNLNNASSTPDYLSQITRDADFSDTLAFSKKSDLFVLKAKLETTVRNFGATRTQVFDLCRMRLTQLRHCLETTS